MLMLTPDKSNFSLTLRNCAFAHKILRVRFAHKKLRMRIRFLKTHDLCDMQYRKLINIRVVAFSSQI